MTDVFDRSAKKLFKLTFSIENIFKTTKEAIVGSELIQKSFCPDGNRKVEIKRFENHTFRPPFIYKDMR